MEMPGVDAILAAVKIGRLIVGLILVADAKFTLAVEHEEVGHKNWNPNKVVL